MYDVDVDGSIAYSKGLLKAGVLNEHEQKVIERGLNIVREEWASGRVCLYVLCRFITLNGHL
jgi:argininosuccinate lyase